MPDHVVDLLLDGGHPAAPGLQGDLQRRLDRLVGPDGHHVGPGHHHLAHHGVAELDDRVDEGALLGLDDVPLDGHVGHGQQLGLGHRGRRRTSPFSPMMQVGQADEAARHHPDRPEADDRRDQRRAEQGGPLGVADGPVLGHRLGEHEDHHDLEHGGRHHAPGPEPPHGQDADQGGHHQLADQHQQEHRVEEALGVLGEADQHLGPPLPVVGQALGLGPARADEAGLGQGQQRRGDQQDHDDHDDRTPSSGVKVAAVVRPLIRAARGHRAAAATR